MSLETMQILWYIVICTSIVCYVMLDGFDLGVGCLHLLAKNDSDRRIFLNSIGPVWDGNAVWIVIVGGATFAGFPDAYAAVFSGFYNLTMALLCGFIFRAVAIEFRSKRASKRWRGFWDLLFCFASYAIAFAIGVILGNIVVGVPLNEERNFTGSFMDFFNPYSILLGLTSISLLGMHGAIYLSLKTEGDLHEKVKRWVFPSTVLFIICYIAATLATLTFTPYMVKRMVDHPALFLLPMITLLTILAIPYQTTKMRNGWAFLFSCIAIALLFSLFGIGTFPHLVRSSYQTELLSLTLFNASASAATLRILLIIAGIGVPLVLGYGYYVYRIFRGKVKLDSSSY